MRNYHDSRPKRNNIAFVTAICGGYEELKVPEHFDCEIDYFFFCDDQNQSSFEPFTKIVLDKFETDPTRLARWVKLNHYRVLELIGHYDYVIWVDANLLVRSSLMPYIKLVQEQAGDFGVFHHPSRSSLSQEVEACQRMNKDSLVALQHQHEEYARRYDMSLLDSIPLIESNVYVVNTSSQAALRLLQDWYAEVFQYTRRDQLSYPVARYQNQKARITCLEIGAELTPRFNKSCFEIFKHSDRASYKSPLYLEPSKTINCTELEMVCADQSARRLDSLSIIVPVHNALDEFSQLLRSIENQNDPDFEFIVVDDASDEETRSFLAKGLKNLDDVQLIRNDQNKGYTKSVNIGLRQARHQLVTVLNSDTVLSEDFVRTIKDRAFMYPGIAAFGPITNAGSWQNVPFLHDENGALAVNQLPQGVSVDEMNQRLQKCHSAAGIVKVNLLNGFCYTVRRRAFDEVGLLDEDRFPRGYGEEDDFFIRLGIRGFQAAVIKDLYVFHHKTRSFTPAEKRELSSAGLRTLRDKYSRELVRRLVRNSSDNPALKAHREFIRREFY